MLQDLFKEDMNLAVEENPISFLFQFIIHGFFRTHAKDIYQLQLSNALLSRYQNKYIIIQCEISCSQGKYQ